MTASQSAGLFLGRLAPVRPLVGASAPGGGLGSPSPIPGTGPVGRKATSTWVGRSLFAEMTQVGQVHRQVRGPPLAAGAVGRAPANLECLSLSVWATSCSLHSAVTFCFCSECELSVFWGGALWAVFSSPGGSCNSVTVEPLWPLWTVQALDRPF